MRALAVALLVLFASASPALARARPNDGGDELRAASKLFEAKEYRAALPHFVKAYELSERKPETIFALAQCERALKMDHSAVVHFREYLKTGPEETRAAEVHAMLTVLLERGDPGRL